MYYNCFQSTAKARVKGEDNAKISRTALNVL